MTLLPLHFKDWYDNHLPLYPADFSEPTLIYFNGSSDIHLVAGVLDNPPFLKYQGMNKKSIIIFKNSTKCYDLSRSLQFDSVLQTLLVSTGSYQGHVHNVF